MPPKPKPVFVKPKRDVLNDAVSLMKALVPLYQERKDFNTIRHYLQDLHPLLVTSSNPVFIEPEFIQEYLLASMEFSDKYKGSSRSIVLLLEIVVELTFNHEHKPFSEELVLTMARRMLFDLNVKELRSSARIAIYSLTTHIFTVYGEVLEGKVGHLIESFVTNWHFEKDEQMIRPFLIAYRAIVSNPACERAIPLQTVKLVKMVSGYFPKQNRLDMMKAEEREKMKHQKKESKHPSTDNQEDAPPEQLQNGRSPPYPRNLSESPVASNNQPPSGFQSLGATPSPAQSLTPTSHQQQNVEEDIDVLVYDCLTSHTAFYPQVIESCISTLNTSYTKTKLESYQLLRRLYRRSFESHGSSFSLKKTYKYTDSLWKAIVRDISHTLNEEIVWSGIETIQTILAALDNDSGTKSRRWEKNSQSTIRYTSSTPKVSSQSERAFISHCIESSVTELPAHLRETLSVMITFCLDGLNKSNVVNVAHALLKAISLVSPRLCKAVVGSVCVVLVPFLCKGVVWNTEIVQNEASEATNGSPTTSNDNPKDTNSSGTMFSVVTPTPSPDTPQTPASSHTTTVQFVPHTHQNEYLSMSMPLMRAQSMPLNDRTAGFSMSTKALLPAPTPPPRIASSPILQALFANTRHSQSSLLAIPSPPLSPLAMIGHPSLEHRVLAIIVDLLESLSVVNTVSSPFIPIHLPSHENGQLKRMRTTMLPFHLMHALFFTPFADSLTLVDVGDPFAIRDEDMLWRLPGSTTDIDISVLEEWAYAELNRYGLVTQQTLNQSQLIANVVNNESTGKAEKTSPPMSTTPELVQLMLQFSPVGEYIGKLDRIQPRFTRKVRREMRLKAEHLWDRYGMEIKVVEGQGLREAEEDEKRLRSDEEEEETDESESDGTRDLNQYQYNLLPVRSILNDLFSTLLQSQNEIIQPAIVSAVQSPFSEEFGRENNLTLLSALEPSVHSYVTYGKTLLVNWMRIKDEGEERDEDALSNENNQMDLQEMGKPVENYDGQSIVVKAETTPEPLKEAASPSDRHHSGKSESSNGLLKGFFDTQDSDNSDGELIIAADRAASDKPSISSSGSTSINMFQSNTELLATHLTSGSILSKQAVQLLLPYPSSVFLSSLTTARPLIKLSLNLGGNQNVEREQYPTGNCVWDEKTTQNDCGDSTILIPFLSRESVVSEERSREGREVEKVMERMMMSFSFKHRSMSMESLRHFLARKNGAAHSSASSRSFVNTRVFVPLLNHFVTSMADLFLITTDEAKMFATDAISMLEVLSEDKNKLVYTQQKSILAPGEFFSFFFTLSRAFSCAQLMSSVGLVVSIIRSDNVNEKILPRMSGFLVGLMESVNQVLDQSGPQRSNADSTLETVSDDLTQLLRFVLGEVGNTVRALMEKAKNEEMVTSVATLFACLVQLETDFADVADQTFHRQFISLFSPTSASSSLPLPIALSILSSVLPSLPFDKIGDDNTLHLLSALSSFFQTHLAPLLTTPSSHLSLTTPSPTPTPNPNPQESDSVKHYPDGTLVKHFSRAIGRFVVVLVKLGEEMGWTGFSDKMNEMINGLFQFVSHSLRSTDNEPPGISAVLSYTILFSLSSQHNSDSSDNNSQPPSHITLAHQLFGSLSASLLRSSSSPFFLMPVLSIIRSLSLILFLLRPLISAPRPSHFLPLHTVSVLLNTILEEIKTGMTSSASLPDDYLIQNSSIFVIIHGTMVSLFTSRYFSQFENSPVISFLPSSFSAILSSDPFISTMASCENSSFTKGLRTLKLRITQSKNTPGNDKVGKKGSQRERLVSSGFQREWHSAYVGGSHDWDRHESTAEEIDVPLLVSPLRLQTMFSLIVSGLYQIMNTPQRIETTSEQTLVLSLSALKMSLLHPLLSFTINSLFMARMENANQPSLVLPSCLMERLSQNVIQGRIWEVGMMEGTVNIQEKSEQKSRPVGWEENEDRSDAVLLAASRLSEREKELVFDCLPLPRKKEEPEDLAGFSIFDDDSPSTPSPAQTDDEDGFVTALEENMLWKQVNFFPHTIHLRRLTVSISLQLHPHLNQIHPNTTILFDLLVFLLRHVSENLSHLGQASWDCLVIDCLECLFVLPALSNCGTIKGTVMTLQRAGLSLARNGGSRQFRAFGDVLNRFALVAK
ncbi:hypothetical protein BLNAU_14844 [Blattamonas nauphoetae]|uniref:HECT-type E3 ubiquitin transferase n=1 Tax=Blattamonas nauphoetae TaxID=2049346 RepID=A0ABQ9XJB1_9EUKA|nr:hypothetical protein BLNAU_14844 [Blattamonas nauphoetae]